MLDIANKIWYNKDTKGRKERKKLEQKIDKRVHYILNLDTETCNSLDDALPYDIGGAIIDKRGNIYETFSFVIYEYFVGEKELMVSSYYAEKIPTYWEDIQSGKRQLVRLATAKKRIADLCEKYNIDTVCAYNARFDYNSLNKGLRWETKSKLRYFLPYGLTWWDSMKMAQDVVGKMPTYKRFCEENGFMTNHKVPRPQLKAETVYRFITKDTTFVEEHKGLDDVMIETEIIKYCFNSHKKMRKLLWEN